MNSLCTICSEIFSFPTAVVYSTPCGHVFDYTCLLQWLERSPTCPQCRNKCTEKSIHRIYFTFANTVGLEDAVTLQSKLDTKQFQLDQQAIKLKKSKERITSLENCHLGLRKEVQDLMDRERTLKSKILGLKEQISIYKMKVKLVDELTEETISLKTRIQHLESQQLVLNGTQEEVNNMLRNKSDPGELSFLVATLKRTLEETNKQKTILSSNLRTAEQESSKFRKEAALCAKEIDKLKLEIESHKNCETERKYLKRKIKQLKEETDGSDCEDVSVKRILYESPAPLSIKKKRLVDLVVNRGQHDSPTVEERVTAIKNSDSPYLNVKSNSLGLLGDPFRPGTSKGIKSRISSNTVGKSASSSMVYDGLGGHSKIESVPSTITKVSNLKKNKSTSRLPSTKFKKLAPQKKIDRFLSQNE